MSLFKPRTINEACVQAQYMENMGMTKGQPSGSKKKGNQDASKEKKKVERRGNEHNNHYKSMQVSK